MGQKSRRQHLESTLTSLQKRWGARAICRAGDIAVPMLPACSSDFREVDEAVGIGGFPRGRFSELIGYGTAGHLSVAAATMAQAHRQGEQVAYVDVVAGVDLDALVRCGVQLDMLIVLRPRGFLHGLAMTGDLLRAGALGVIVFDRLCDLPLLAEGEALRAFDLALREWTPLVSQSLCVFLFLTETAAPGRYPPGLPLSYFASVRLEFVRQGWLYRNERIVDYVAQGIVLKNKLGAAGRRATLRIMTNQRLHRRGDGHRVEDEVAYRLCSLHLQRSGGALGDDLGGSGRAQPAGGGGACLGG